jgi:monoamine oxidase
VSEKENEENGNMAKSSILQTLRRLASEHAEADALGISVERVRERRRAAVSRRTVLKAAGAAAGLAVVGRARIARAHTNPPRIAIVGGGIAGLNAALTLQDAGYASTVYEASGRIGGRMHSNTTTWVQGQTSEWCGEFIDSSHTTILGLAQRFGLTVIDEIAAQPAGSTDTLYFFGNYYSVKQADKDFAPVWKVLSKQNNDAPFPTVYNSYTPAGKALDEMSAYDWIEQYVPGGHGSDMGAYIDSAYTNEFGLDTDEQSSLNIVYEIGFQDDPKHFNIYGQSDQRYHVFGGNDQIPAAIAASMPAGSVQLGWFLESIAKNHDGSFTLTFSTSHGCQVVVADRVILTVPFGVLRGLDYSHAGFDALKNTAIQELGYGTNSKLILQFTERLWNQHGPWGVGDGNIYTDLSFQNAWDSSRGIGGTAGVLVAFNGGADGVALGGAGSPYASASNDPRVVAYAQQLLTQLKQPWPGIQNLWNGRATLSTPWRDPNLLGSYSCWKVGQYTLFSGYEGVRQGKCHFAGEHTSTDYQGFMEGAAEEGARAAGEILSDYAAGIFP